MTMPSKCVDRDAACRCGRTGCKGARPMDIVVEKGHVRRAIVAADAVTRMATTAPQGPENGVVLMTALLLVERLARAYACEPHAMLAKMATSFELKRRHVSIRQHN